jgi:hypothetical protein
MTDVDTVLSDDEYSMLSLVMSSQVVLRDGQLQCQLVKEPYSFVQRDYAIFKSVLDKKLVCLYGGARQILMTNEGEDAYLRELIRRQCVLVMR